MVETTVQPDGDKLKQLRIAKTWTQENLAEKVGCSKRTIENAEAGKRIKQSYLEYIAEALGVPSGDLVLPISHESNVSVRCGASEDTPRKPKVFISHSSRDTWIALRIAEVINKAVHNFFRSGSYSPWR